MIKIKSLSFTEAKETRFSLQATSFYTELPNNNYHRQKNDPVKLSLLQTDLLEQIKLNIEITRHELCERLNVSLATVRRTIAQLKDMGLLERVGSDKKGHWIVCDKKRKLM